MSTRNDRTAIITGSSKGIGRAIAIGFAQAGFRLVLCAREEKSVRRVADEIVGIGGTAVALSCDVSKRQDVQVLVDSAMEAYGRIDILVANAGVLEPRATVEKMPLQEWQNILHINMTGVMLCNQAVLPHMIRQRYGRIQNMGSPLEYTPVRRLAAYAASKGAVHAFTRVLAAEVSDHNVKVNLHYPGDLRTRINPKGRGEPEDAVRCALYLASLPDDGPSGRTFMGDEELVFEAISRKVANLAPSNSQQDRQVPIESPSPVRRSDVSKIGSRPWSRFFRRAKR